MSNDDGTPAPQDVRTREELGAALTAARLASGLSVRDLSRRTGLPLATVGGYLSGRHLPPLATLDQFTGLLTVLGVPDEAMPAWLDAVARLRRVPGPRPATAVAPYLGLRAYQADDSALFFGREAATENLVDLVSSAPRTPVVVVGSSGSGKSSLLRAGVQARLAAAGRPVTVVTPGSDPSGLAQEPDAVEPGGVLVVDQFEELFTAGGTPEQVADAVARLGRLHAHGTVVVIALRADFFDAAVQVPELAAWMAAHQVLVGPLSTDELRRIVVEPARVAGVEVDDGLVELLIADATAGSSTRAGLDAGALPLASHALYVTWLAASGRRLTLEQYRQVGRLAGAIAQTAEAVHNELTPEAEAVEKATFLRLVRVGAGMVDTRRVADAHEFASPERQAVIRAYVAARLLTSDRGRVQIAHEALLSAWPRMREWLDADREGLRVHGRLTDAARRWHDMEQDPDLLYRGAALETADRWTSEAANPPDLSTGEREFLDRSRGAERSRLDSQRRSTWRLRALAMGLAVLTLATATLAGVSASQASASAHQTDLAVSRQLAVQAEALASTDPALAGQLAVAADQRAETVEARSALLSASGRDAVTRTDSLDAVVSTVAVSPDGATLVAGTGDGRVVLEKTGAHPQRIVSLTTGDTSLYAVTFSPDGSLLAAVGDGGTVRLWHVTDPAVPTAVPVTAPAAKATYYDVVFTPDGSTIVAGASDGTVHLLARGADGTWSQTQTITATKGSVQAVAVDPAGTVVAAAGSAASITLWSLTSAGLSPIGAPFTVAKTKVTTLAFSPDGATLAAGSTDAGVHLWDVRTPSAPTAGAQLTGPASWTNHVAFSPDGKAIAAASSDQHLWVWDAATGIRLDSFTHPTTLLATAWSPDGASLYSAGSDGILRTWRYPGATLQGFSSVPGQGVFGATVIATATTDGLRLWDGAADGA
ncbi:MAG TPA: helix-turn-helix domain-containing protein, partial [Propionicimonas sp.]